MSNIIRFRNFVQVTLFTNELSGQISDGNWENASPANHWEFWCKADVVVHKERPGVQADNPYRIRRRSYNFSDPFLLGVIGKRMIAAARLSLVLNRVLTQEEYYAAEYTCDSFNSEFDYENWEATVEKAYGGHGRAIEYFRSVPIEKMKEAFSPESRKGFSKKELVAELNDMKAIIKEDV